MNGTNNDIANSQSAGSWAAPNSGNPQSFEPKIVAIFCNWCTYMASDLAGTSRVKYAPNVRIVRVMCSGRFEPQLVMWAFHNGADGVLVGGCNPGDCHYQEGNYKALRRVMLLKKLLPQLGIEPERLRLEWICAACAEEMKHAANSFTEELRLLGPLQHVWKASPEAPRPEATIEVPMTEPAREPAREGEVNDYVQV
jgi:F420-non-reducing hydrogenase iron-sulfur subunit